MEWIWGYIIRLFPVVLLIMFIVSLIFFFKSPKGSQKRGIWKVLSIVFGAINGAMLLFVLAIMKIMITDIMHM